MKPFIIITGMHRSGTSFLIRSFNLLGVYLGDNESIITDDWRPHKSNLRGHWENQYFLNLTNKTLSNNKGSWFKVPKNIQITKEMGKEIKKNIATLEKSSLLASGFKDPRMLPCFESLLQYSPKNLVMIGIFRHPLKVAESLKIRSNFEYDKSLKLWQIYNKILLEILEKHNGFLLDFDWPKNKMLDEIMKIGKKLGLANIDLSECSNHGFRFLKSSNKGLFYMKLIPGLKQLGNPSCLLIFLPSLY